MQNKQKISYKKQILRFLPYFKPYWGLLILDLIAATLTSVCELALPLIVRDILGNAQKDIALLAFDYIMKMGILYVMFRLVDSVAFYFMATMGHVMGVRLEADMRKDIFKHLSTLPLSYHNHTKVGQLMSRLTSDLFDVTEFAHHCPEEFWIAGVKFTAAFIILIRINVTLTLLIFIMIPIMYFCTKYFSKRMRQAFRESRYQVGEINAQLEDSLLGMPVVQSFANEHVEVERFNKENRRFVGIRERSYKYMGGFHTVVRLFDGLMYIIVVIIGALFIRDGSISTADYVAYLLYVSTLLTVVRRIVEFTEQFQRGMTGIERFSEVMEVKSEIIDSPDAKELKTLNGNIEFQDVSFGYDKDNPKVLSGINEIIHAGDHIALVGPSGGGKTTLVKLIPHFFNLNNGKILIDGIDINKIKLYSLRSAIGVVQQDVYLFSGTVFDNIQYGKPGASLEEVVNAAKQANAHDFIMQLPDGYNTSVGERGVRLSGGQKQRLSIARVFLKNPPILILDEATSALDNESERIVQTSLDKLAKGRTTITIAHRLTTIRNASSIWVLTENGVVEKGTHDELINSGGLYAKYHEMYTE